MKNDLKTLKKHLNIIQEQYEKYNEMANYIGLFPESEMSKPLYTLMENYVELLSDVYDDNLEWIDYFIWECDWGKRPGEVNIYGEDVTLDSIEMLYYLLIKRSVKPTG